MAALRSLLDAGGGVAIVSGEAGIGKSRLIREFAAEAASRGRVVLWGRPEEVAQPGPYALIVDLLESIAERGDSGVKNDARSLAGDLADPNLDESYPATTPRVAAAETRGLIARLSNNPLIVLEDLHWGDEASHSVVLHLCRAARDDGHAILASLRPDDRSHPTLRKLVDALRRDRMAEEIALTPLPDSLIGDMLSAMWGRQPSADRLGEIARRAEGVPFFVEELARSPEESGHVPESVGHAIQTRLDGVSSEARRIITLASLMLGAIDAPTLSSASDSSVESVRSSLLEAAGAGLVVDREGRLVFRHALVREAISSSVVSVEASRLHSKLALAIEKQFASNLQSHATSLMHHYTLAGNSQQASKFAVVAGEHALALASLSEARSAFAHAIEQSRRENLDALAGIAEVEFREGNEERASMLFREAADAFLTHGRTLDAARQLKRLAWASIGRIEPAGVEGILDEALEWLGGAEDSGVYAETLVQKGSMLAFLFNRFEEAQPLLAKGASIAERRGDSALLAECLDGLAHVAENTGAWQEALTLSERATVKAQRSDSSEIIGRTHNNFAIKLACYGRPVEAVSVLDTGRQNLRRGHGRAAVGALDVTNAWIARLMGRPDEVRGLIARAQGIWQRWRIHRWVLEAWASVEQGDLEHSRDVVEAAWSELGGPEVKQLWVSAAPSLNPERSQILQAELIVLLGEQRFDEALGVARALVSMDREVGEKFDLGYSLSLLARSALSADAKQESDFALAELEQLLDSFPYPFLRAAAIEVHALTTTDAGDGSLFLEAANHYQLIANDLDRARCLRLAADSLVTHSTSERARAIDLLRQALQLADSIGARREQNQIEAQMRSLGARPRVGRPRGKRVEGVLSPREAEVVVLVAGGASNVEIGHRLFLSDRTVQDHISHALRKLGLHSRAALASWAVKQGMI